MTDSHCPARQLQTQATADTAQHDANHAGVAVTGGEHVKPKGLTQKQPAHGTADKAAGVGDTMNPFAAHRHAGLTVALVHEHQLLEQGHILFIF